MTRGARGSRFSDNLNPLKTVNELYDEYDFVASFAVADSTTDYDVKTQQSTAFKNVPFAHGVIIWCDQDISIKFNDTDNPAIVHEAVYAPHEWFDKLKISNIYISNSSGNTANVKIFLV